MAGLVSSEHSTTVYLLVPGQLAALAEPLRAHFSADSDADSGIAVIVESRVREVRGEGERRSAAGDRPRSGERRRIRSESGRRVGDRRATPIPIESPGLPRFARRHAERLIFFERLEPALEHELDIEAARLVVSCQAGEPGAFAGLYTCYFDRVYGYARVALRNHHDAEDVTQQVFANAAAALSRYEIRSGSPFRVWLFTIARNTITSAAARRGKLLVEDPATIDQLREASAPAELTEPLDWLQDRDLAIFVERLTVDQLQVLTLRYRLEMTPTEIAAVLGRSRDAVDQLHSRALRTLRGRLAAVGRGGSESRARRAPMRNRLRPVRVIASRRFALAGTLSGRPLR